MALELYSSALRLYDRGQGTVLTVRPADLEGLHLGALSGDGRAALYLQGTVAGSAAMRFCPQSRGDPLRLVMAENMGPWLREFSASRWKVEGNREKFADAWRCLVEEQFPVGGMLHLAQPPSVPPVWPAAPPAAAAKPAPKAAPKPLPKRSPPPEYGSYANIRYALQHFGDDRATEQRGSKAINVCPWSRLDVAGNFLGKAGKHCRPAHLLPKDLLDHLQRDHAADLAQRDQALAMLPALCWEARQGLSHRPTRGPERSCCLRVPAPQRGEGRRSWRHSPGQLGLQRRVQRCIPREVRRQVRPGEKPRGGLPHLPSLSRRWPPRAGTHGDTGRLASRPRPVLVDPLRPMMQIQRGALVRRRSCEGAPPPTLERRCPGTSRARCGGTAYQWPQVCSMVRRRRRAE